MTSPKLAYSKKNSGRHYTHPQRDDVDYPSVTNILDVLSKPLLGWAARETAGAAWDNRHALVEIEDRQTAVDMLKGAPFKKRDRRADLGDIVHSVAEALAGDTALPNYPREAEGYVEAFLQWVSDFGVEFLYTEFTVFNHNYAYAGTADALVDIAGRKVLCDWKGLALDTPLPTPGGWTTMGEVTVGDEVLSAEGLPCRITGKSSVHHRPCYLVTFDDGSSVVADNEHLWVVDRGRSGQRQRRVMSTEAMAADLHNPSSGQRWLRIDNAELDLPECDLPIDPYVLGAWLGDGTHTEGQICKPHEPLFAEIEKRGYEVGPDTSSPYRAEIRTVYGLRGQLGALGLLGNKHVPDQYLRASRQQRLDLLRGLMDTDGYWNQTRQRAVVTTTAWWMVEAFYELVCSLGWTASVFPLKKSGFGEVWQAWDLCFTPIGEQVFLTRPPADYRPSSRVARRRLVKSVERTETVPTQCIAVDSPSSTYLCGRQMVPTHNTSGSGIYKDTALQLAALAHAQEMALPSGEVITMPKVDAAVALHLTPDGAKHHPINDVEEAFQGFLGARQLWQWVNDHGDRAISIPVDAQSFIDPFYGLVGEAG